MQLPVTISNIHGESLTFLRYTTDTEGRQIVEVENEVAPNSGPPMHVHYKQDESLTVVEGKMGYQVLGGEKKYAGPGESVTFKAGTPHKFWNAGEGMLRCRGWVSPPNTIVYFLAEIYKSTNENKGRPGTFDAAYLLHRYRGEYYMNEIPPFVQKVIFPIVRTIGVLQGKHKKFKGAPEPV